MSAIVAAERAHGRSAASPISFTVPGRAQPAGSKSGFAFQRKNGKLGVAMRDGKTKESAARHSDWRALVSLAARKEMGSLSPIDSAVALSVVVVFARPAGHFGKHGLNKKGLEMPFPAVKPDWDKLGRSISDALKAIVWTDDARVCRASVEKKYGERDEVRIEVSRL